MSSLIIQNKELECHIIFRNSITLEQKRVIMRIK